MQLKQPPQRRIPQVAPLNHHREGSASLIIQMIVSVRVEHKQRGGRVREQGAVRTSPHFWLKCYSFRFLRIAEFSKVSVLPCAICSDTRSSLFQLNCSGVH